MPIRGLTVLSSSAACHPASHPCPVLRHFPLKAEPTNSQGGKAELSRAHWSMFIFMFILFVVTVVHLSERCH
ncbi:hypothetical protein PROFUN_08299 [Planoprotostelium fungivorum]|uniref:Uncharacterized protein n=1 Tax=Planoprotostelium fungivorum TaxID=1890364 RepID=A0A2P6NK26_9EUKA|nr:hypothetical protein PROFUN_08299 [Planoprotostelium fungivorum]